MQQKFAAGNFCRKLLRKTSAENFCGIQNPCAWQYTIELRQTLKSPRRVKISAFIKKLGAHQKVRRISSAPAYYLGSADLQLLTSSKPGWRALVQVMSPLAHVDLKWSEGSGCSAFMGGVSPVLYRPVVSARLVKTSADGKFSARA